MSFSRKISLYFHTIRHLRRTQIWHRLTFRLGHPKPDLSAAPPAAKSMSVTSFPRMAACHLGGEHFRFLNEECVFPGWNSPERGKLWLYNLHYFDWLRQEGLPGTEGSRWIAKWIAENPPPLGNGWEPYPLSLRIVNWIKWHLSGHALSDLARHSLAVQVRFLMKRLEFHLMANHLMANAKALIYAGCFFSGSEAKKWLAKGLEIYQEQLPEQILPDGGHFELSPMYHSIILEDLLDLVNIGAPLFLHDAIGRMLRWLAVMTGPDGRIAHFNDAADGIALSPEQIFNYAEQLGFPRPKQVTASCDLPDSGYARLTAGKWTAICDGGAIGPDYQPGHAHADTLSFELWHGQTRLLVDSGTGEYIDTALRREQRGTAGHNTLVADGKNSSAVWGAHRVAERARIIRRSFSENRFLGAHDGYAPILHQREWHLSSEKVDIVDRAEGKGAHRLEVFWHFAPESRITLGNGVATIELQGMEYTITLPANGTCEIQKGHYSPGFGIIQEIPILHVFFEATLPWNSTTTIKVKS